MIELIGVVKENEWDWGVRHKMILKSDQDVRGVTMSVVFRAPKASSKWTSNYPGSACLHMRILKRGDEDVDMPLSSPIGGASRLWVGDVQKDAPVFVEAVLDSSSRIDRPFVRVMAHYDNTVIADDDS